MKKITSFCIKTLGLILFFGLCITMRSKEVEVFAAEGEAKLNVTSVSVIKEGTYRLKVFNLSGNETVVYRSNDTSIATVTSSGVIKGVDLGKTIITCTILEEETPVATLQCEVHIGPAAISIKFTKSEVVLMEGESKLLNYIIAPLNTVEEPVFYSTEPEKVSVSTLGRVRAKETGVVQIYAFLTNQQTACCTIFVLDEEQYARYEAGEDIDSIIETQLESEEETDDEADAFLEEADEETAMEIDEVPVEELDEQTEAAEGSAEDSEQDIEELPPVDEITEEPLEETEQIPE